MCKETYSSQQYLWSLLYLWNTTFRGIILQMAQLLILFFCIFAFILHCNHILIVFQNHNSYQYY